MVQDSSVVCIWFDKLTATIFCKRKEIKANSLALQDQHHDLFLILIIWCLHSNQGTQVIRARESLVKKSHNYLDLLADLGTIVSQTQS